jgi:hypothetical protein
MGNIKHPINGPDDVEIPNQKNMVSLLGGVWYERGKDNMKEISHDLTPSSSLLSGRGLIKKQHEMWGQIFILSIKF